VPRDKLLIGWFFALLLLVVLLLPLRLLANSRACLCVR
jgi:hypothetical protein